MKTLLRFAVIALIIWSISQAPGPWAEAVGNGGDKVADAAEGFGEFVTRLAR